MSYEDILDSKKPIMFDYRTCISVLKQHGADQAFIEEHGAEAKPYDARYILEWLGY
jgi:hypothetical protein